MVTAFIPMSVQEHYKNCVSYFRSIRIGSTVCQDACVARQGRKKYGLYFLIAIYTVLKLKKAVLKFLILKKGMIIIFLKCIRKTVKHNTVNLDFGIQVPLQGAIFNESRRHVNLVGTVHLIWIHLVHSRVKRFENDLFLQWSVSFVNTKMNATTDRHPKAERNNNNRAHYISPHKLDKTRYGRRLDHLPKATHVIFHSLHAFLILAHAFHARSSVRQILGTFKVVGKCLVQWSTLLTRICNDVSTANHALLILTLGTFTSSKCVILLLA